MIGRRVFCTCALAAVAPRIAPAEAAASAGPPAPRLLEDLVAANRILFDQGVVDGFGHVSARHDRDPSRFLLARSMAPALVTEADIMEFDLDGNPVDPNGRTPYLERFIHGEIYRVRADVQSVVHSHSPAVIPFADSRVPLRPLYHISSFLGSGAPVFEIRTAGGPGTDMLIRNRELGHALATTLGDSAVVLMRGHGSTVVGRSIREAVFRAIYTETNAKLQHEALALGDVTYLNPEEATKATETNAALIDRPWELWRKKAMPARGP